MSCPKFEAHIALYASDDLPQDRSARIQQHLAECGDCREFLEEVRAGRVLLAELRDAAPDEIQFEDVMIAQVRRRVMAQIAASRPAPLYWKLALAAALVLAAILLWPRHRTAQPARIARVEAPRTWQAPPVKIVPVRHRTARRRAPQARRRQAVKPGAPLLVQFVTNDPNIVIYWLVDEKPQGD